MTDSKRAFWFVVGMIAFLTYGYFSYVKDRLPTQTQETKKIGFWSEIEAGINDVVKDVKSEIESEFGETSSESDGETAYDESEIPDSEEAFIIAAVPLTAFTASVSIDDFTPFYSVISEEWKERAGTPEFLRDVVFGYVMTRNLRLTGPSDLEITSEPRMIDETHLLIEGTATSGGRAFDFNLIAVEEEGAWKASGLEVHFEE